jgi:hypothetical protein
MPKDKRWFREGGNKVCWGARGFCKSRGWDGIEMKMKTGGGLTSRGIFLGQHARKPAEEVLVVAEGEQDLGGRDRTGDGKLDLAHAESSAAHHLLNHLLCDDELPRVGLAVALADDEIQTVGMVLPVTEEFAEVLNVVGTGRESTLNGAWLRRCLSGICSTVIIIETVACTCALVRIITQRLHSRLFEEEARRDQMPCNIREPLRARPLLPGSVFQVFHAIDIVKLGRFAFELDVETLKAKHFVVRWREDSHVILPRSFGVQTALDVVDGDAVKCFDVGGDAHPLNGLGLLFG